jgi:ABC-2 type transport system permease protein
MRTLLQIEWLKLKKYRTFWVLYIFMLISFPAVVSLVYVIQTEFPRKARVIFDPVTFFKFPYIWQTTAWLGGFLMILPALLIITLVTNEYTFKTHRQNIIDGLNRLQFIFSKWMIVLGISLSATISVLITAFCFGLICGKELSVTSYAESLQYVFYFLVEILDYLSVAMLLSLLIKRAGLAMGAFFLYAWIIEKIIYVIFEKNNSVIGHYLPLQVTDSLIPNPFFNKLPGVTADTTSPVVYLLFIAAYIVLFSFIEARMFNRADL